MNSEKFEERCISYLYNEMSEVERREFQNHLATNRESNLKFSAIRKAKIMLGTLPRIEPAGTAGIERPAWGESGPAISGDSKSGNETTKIPGQTAPPLRILPGTLWGRIASAAAVILFGILIAGAITGMQIRWDNSGFTLSMSLFGTAAEPAPPVYLLEEETLEQLRNQQEQLFSEILAAEREQQRIMLLETLSEYAEAIETRRMIDMQLIGMELADFQQQTNQQLSQTDRVIYQIIETLSYQQEQQDE